MRGLSYGRLSNSPDHHWGGVVTLKHFARAEKFTKSFLLIPVILLAACANHQAIVSDAASKCPQIGIDVDAPDFYQKHKQHAIEKFYNCMETVLKPNGSSFVFGREGSPGRNMLTALNQGNETKASIHTALEYQKNLWRQVLSKEKAPGAAYEAWVRWMQAERNMAASKQAADEAASAAYLSNNAAQQQQFQTNFQLQQQNMQLQKIQQQQFMNNSMNGRY